MIFRTAFVGVVLIHLAYGLLFLTGRGAERPPNNAIGMLIFGLFVLSLILHVTLIVAARSWGIGIMAALSVCVLIVLLFWVLHSVTGDSL